MAKRMMVTVLGSGSIGTAFAILFARAGCKVKIWDKFPEALERSQKELAEKASSLANHKLVDSSQILGLIEFESNLENSLAETNFVQEAVPEKVEIKRELFDLVVKLTNRHTPIVSSTSAILPSLINDADPKRILVGHPGNPPFLLPVIEVVPSSQTDLEILSFVQGFYANIGMYPVLVRKEISGFIFNRLQGAVLREAYCLVRDGVASVRDIDTVMKYGLGRRWSIIGPFETSDLNTRGGIESHAQKMGPAYFQMGQERGQNDPWTEELVKKVALERREIMPEEKWEERVKWRDQALMQLIPIWNKLLN